MYTVKEISETLEVSRQTVYTYLKDNSIDLNGHVFKNKNVTYIDDEGLRIIKIAMGLIQVPTLNENDISIQNIIDSITDSLKESLMQELRVENDRLIEEYENGIIDIKKELNAEMQELKDQNMKLLEKINELSENQDKKGFFERLFKK